MSNGPVAYKYKYGCVIFDNIYEHNSGYAAKAGESAKRIRSTQDLDSDVVWLTNLSFEVMRRSGFTQHARFRRDTYLRMKASKIVSNLGIDDPEEQARVLALLMDRVNRIAYDFFQIGFSPGRELKQTIRQSLNLGPDPIVPKEISDALYDATQYFNRPEKPGYNGGFNWENRVTFEVRPFDILKEVLLLDLPFGSEWTRLHVSRLPPVANIQELKDKIGGPFLAKVSITDIDANFNHMLNIGSMPQPGSQRHWMSSVELECLHDIASIEMQEVIKPKKHGPYHAPILEKVLKLHEACHVSLSYQLFFDALWNAVGTNYPPPGVKGLGYRIYSPAAPFSRALDREICMNAALFIASKGLDVVSYGAGSVRVELSDETPEVLLDAAMASKTIPPMTAAGDFMAADEVQDSLSALQKHFINGETEVILEVDEQVVEGMLTYENEAAE